MKVSAILLTTFAVIGHLTSTVSAEPYPSEARLIARQIYQQGASALESSLYRRALDLEADGSLTVARLFARDRLRDQQIQATTSKTKANIEGAARKVEDKAHAAKQACKAGWQWVKNACVKIAGK